MSRPASVFKYIIAVHKLYLTYDLNVYVLQWIGKTDNAILAK